jgi:hypothetical protein
VPTAVFSVGFLDGILCGGDFLFFEGFSLQNTLGNRLGDLVLVEMELHIPYHNQRKQFYASFLARDRNFVYLYLYIPFISLLFFLKLEYYSN